MKIYLAIAGGSAVISLILVLVIAVAVNRGDGANGSDAQDVSKTQNQTEQEPEIAADKDHKLPESRAIRNRQIDDLANEINKLTGNDPNDGHPSRKRIRSFDNLSGEEKNRIWWKIAAVAATTKGEDTKYQLTTRQAMHISSQVGSSDTDVFRLFREGVDADWRTDTPPAALDGETEPDKSRP